jgi:hypothetical protein
LGLCTFIFFICTIALASEKNSAQNELASCQKNTTTETTTQSTSETTSESTITSTPKNPAQGDYRLPQDVEPLNYEIHLKPLMAYNAVNGTVKIKIYGIKETDEIVLHTKGIEINNVGIICENDTSIVVKVKLSGQN